jgi:ABC-2 type transport system permease protein
LVLVPLLCALVAGDIVAAEDGNQTLKTVVTRSTSRGQLLRAKMLATATYVLVLLVSFGLSGTVIGIVANGAEPVPLGGVPLGTTGFTLGAHEIGVGAMLGRLAICIGIYAAPLLAVSSWGFLISTVSRSSPAAIVGMLVFSFANQIIGFLPNIPPAVTRWLLTDQFRAWQGALGTRVDTGAIWHALLVSALFTIPPLVASAWWFRRRDILV